MNWGARGRSWVPAGRVAREPQAENQCCRSPSQKVLKHGLMSMTRGVKRSSPCVISLGRAGVLRRRRRGRRQRRGGRWRRNVSAVRVMETREAYTEPE
jgi:hypothetical protein